MKRLLTCLTVIVGIALITTSKSRLERDAKALAGVIAERILCNFEPAYSGFDGVAGMYDFDRHDQRKFKAAYEQYYAETFSRLSKLTAEQQKQLCENLDLPEDGDTRRIID